jgi:F420H(2)-dependent quinone reductase
MGYMKQACRFSVLQYTANTRRTSGPCMRRLNTMPCEAQTQMKRFKPRTIRWIGRFHAWLWTLTRGRFVDAAKEAPFLLLTTTGRKTGRLRTTPVLYLEEGRDLIVVASFGGNDIHPAWYLNLKESPEAEVMIRGERRWVSAQEISTDQKKLIWPRLAKSYPQFEIYQQRTSREIPLLRLTAKT